VSRAAAASVAAFDSLHARVASLLMFHYMTVFVVYVSECPPANRCDEHGGRINVIRVNCTVAEVPLFGV
jgi:hypothetical protein